MDIAHLVRVARRNALLILAIILVGIASGLAVALLQRPTYTAHTEVYVSTQQAASIQDLSLGSTYTQQIVKSYAQVATAPIVLQPVIADLNLDTTPTKLATSIDVAAPLDTVILDISVRNSNPKLASDIANSVSAHLASAVTTLEPNTTSSASTVRIVRIESATPPQAPTAPDIRLYAVASFLASILIAALAVTVRQRVDTRIRTERDLRQAAQAPVLGAIAFDASLAAGASFGSDGLTGMAAEAFRTLRTNLQFVQFESTGRVIAITSSIESEGKSTTSVNLAAALAEAGVRVVLVDADLRRPRVSNYLGIDEGVGLTDVLIGRVSQSDALQQVGTRQLAVLPAGQLPPNPNELLQSAAMQDLVKSLAGEYDYVLLDTPPLLPVSDALLVAKLAHGALVACSMQRLHRPQLDAALALLRGVDARVLGLVATMSSVRERQSYGYATYGYSGETESGAASVS